MSFQISASHTKGMASGSETTYDNSLIEASKALTLKSGGDTTRAGAQIKAREVSANVDGNGGKLIESATDAAKVAGPAERTGAGVAKTEEVGVKKGGAIFNESLATLNSLATRHYADKVTQTTVAKDLNTVIDRSVVDVSADVSAIRSGQSQMIGDTFVVNGRTYGMHDGTLYPMSGPGLYTLDRGGYKALGVLNKFGDAPQAQVILNNMGVSAETKAAAFDVFKVIKE